MSPCYAYVAGSAADLASSEYAIGRGGVEQNPLQRSAAARVAVQATTAGVGCWADAKLRTRHKNWARGLRVAVLALKIGIAVRNVRQSR